MGDIYGKSVYDELVKNSELYKGLLEENKKLKEEYDNFKKKVSDDMKEIAKYQLENIGLFNKLEEENRKLKERIDILYEFIERNDKLVDEVIDEEDLDKLNRYICIDDDLVDRTLESED